MHCRVANSFIYLFSIILAMFLSACSTENQDGPPDFSVDVSQIHNAIPRAVRKSRYGNPSSYVVNGKRYHVLRTAKGYRRRGIASWYGTKFNGHLTSDRERYNLLAMTAASRVLPIPCYVRVTNLENNRSIIVRVNDRGPFAANRIIDLSYAAALKLGYARKGTALVEVTAINPRHPERTPRTMALRHPRLYLQLGAFRYYNNATRLAANVQRFLHKPIHISTVNYHHHPLYRVRIGPLVDVNESDKLQMQLKQDGYGDAITVIG